jgi:hypothetical protein
MANSNVSLKAQTNTAISDVLLKALKLRLIDLSNDAHTSLLSLCEQPEPRYRALENNQDLGLQVQLAGFSDPAQLQKVLFTSNILNLKTKLTSYQDYDFNPPIITHTQGPLTIRSDIYLVSKDTPSLMIPKPKDEDSTALVVTKHNVFLDFAKQHHAQVEAAYQKALSFTKDTSLKASQQEESRGLLAPPPAELPQITENDTFDDHCVTLLMLSVIFNTMQHKKLANRWDIRAHAVEQCEQIIEQTKDNSDLAKLKPWVQTLPLFNEHRSSLSAFFGRAIDSQKTLLKQIDDKMEKPNTGNNVEMTRF